jgi:hypothetical protein
MVFIKIVLAIITLIVTVVGLIVALRTVLLKAFPTLYLASTGSMLGCDGLTLLKMQDDPSRLFTTVYAKWQEQFSLLCYKTRHLGHEAFPEEDWPEWDADIDKLLGSPASSYSLRELEYMVIEDLADDEGSTDYTIRHRALSDKFRSLTLSFGDLRDVKKQLKLPE